MTVRATRSPTGSIGCALLLAAVTASLWWWHARVWQSPHPELIREPSERVKREHPMPQDPPHPPTTSSETLDAIVRANIFSSQRRLAPPPSHPDQGNGGESAAVPPAPQFVYKGRINLGERRRAIVEDTTIHKTYFLEVGQEVTGFKVLDISENQVVLSDPQHHAELILSLTTHPAQAQGEGDADKTQPHAP